MKEFLDNDFLLETETAKTLFHNYAKKMPIFDYHSHLVPEEIAKNTQFNNLYEIWLSGDHYKWRAMRSFGISEHRITGKASPYEKFEAYAEMLPHAIGNPLYHWTHLELQRYFGITTQLSKSTAKEIWDKTEAILKEKQLGAREFLLMSNVKALCTTDDPVDNLQYHIEIRNDQDFAITVLPTFRPDKAIAVHDRAAYIEYLGKLEAVTRTKIDSFAALIAALEIRIDFFHNVGCRLSDHALSETIFADATDEELSILFDHLLSGLSILTMSEVEKLQTGILRRLAALYTTRNWTMQLHIGAMRNNNSKQFQALGPDAGYDSIIDSPVAFKLSRFLDSVEKDKGLPKTILYVLNPSDNYTIGTMIGNFQDGMTPGKIQFGSGWWFNDQQDGMIAQMKALSSLGLLSQYVGMLTDSRSFLSFPRHEHFRRILCNLIGNWVENGEYPWNEEFLGELVQNISFNNAKQYFGIDLQA